MISFFILYQKSRKQRYGEVCKGCHEYGKGICSGFQKQSIAFRKFEQDYINSIQGSMNGPSRSISRYKT